MIQNQSELLPDLPSRSALKRRGELMMYRLGIGRRNKEQISRREEDSFDLAALLPGGFPVWELHPITATRKLILALLRAFKEIPEAHLHFLQDRHSETNNPPI